MSWRGRTTPRFITRWRAQRGGWVPFMSRGARDVDASGPADLLCTLDPASFRRLLDRSLRRECTADDSASAEMARSIMARLGYTPIDAATARHRRRRTLLRRLGNAVMIVVLVGAGIVVHNHLPGRVTSAPMTVPAAVHDTLEQGGEQIEGFFRAIGTLRRPGPGERHPDAVIELLPPVRRPWPPSEESATAPFRTA